MPGLASKTGKYRLCFRLSGGVGGVLRYSLSGQQRGKGWSWSCPFGLRGSEREPDLTHVSMVGVGQE